MPDFMTAENVIVSDETIDELLPRLRQLGKGCDRTVFALNEHYVLKVAAGNFSDKEWGRDANRNEVTLWKLTESPFLAPIVAYSDSGKWVVMRRAITKNIHHFENPLRTIANTVQCKFGLRDSHYGNFGIIAGEVVMIDYGEAAKLPAMV